MSLFDAMATNYKLPDTVAVLLPRGERFVFRTPSRSELAQITECAKSFQDEIIAIPDLAPYVRMDRELVARCFVLGELFVSCVMPDGTVFDQCTRGEWLQMAHHNYALVDSVFEGLKVKITMTVYGADNDAIEAAKKNLDQTSENSSEPLSQASTSAGTPTSATQEN